MKSNSFPGFPSIRNTVLSSSDCCFPTIIQEPDQKLIPTYFIGTIALLNTSVKTPCRNALAQSYKGMNSSPGWSVSKESATFQCIKSGKLAKWKTLDLQDCMVVSNLSSILKNLSKVSITAGNAEEISGTLVAALEEHGVESAEELQEITNSMSQLRNFSMISKVAENMFEVVSAILNISMNIMAESELRFQTSEKVNMLIHEIAMSYQLNYTETIKIEKRNLAFVAHKADSVAGVSFSAAHSNSGVFLNLSQGKLQLNLSDGNEAVLYLPSSIFNMSEERDGFFYALAMANNNLFLTQKDLTGSDTYRDASPQTVASMIMSATLGGGRIVGLHDEVEMLFRVGMNYINKSIGCYYWNETAETNIALVRGRWMSDGCWQEPTQDQTMVKCKCNHLTNFALLVDPSQTGSNPLSLRIITWIGCGISLTGLALTILTYICFRDLRKSLPSKILICFCLSLLATLLIFLVAVDKTQPRIGCQIAGILIHYFTLTTFFWMSVQAVNLYRNFVIVFNTIYHEDKSFLLTASMYAWGIPMIIVGVTFASKSAFYGPESAQHTQLCLVRGIPFYYSLLFPATFILGCNFAVLCLVLYSIQHTSNIRSHSSLHVSDSSLIRANIRIAFTLTVLLGCTWLFAILAVGDLRDVFQWMFCIFNSLQGFFIFVFYTVRNEEAAREWKRLLHISSIKDTESNPNMMLGGMSKVEAQEAKTTQKKL